MLYNTVQYGCTGIGLDLDAKRCKYTNMISLKPYFAFCLWPFAYCLMMVMLLLLLLLL